ncbi:hypothetical protein PHMEG_0009158 [Phytophthora megakarya]|uniref:Uncharacterized protein n=1 Tax=Phytophthora megakarya TaxID=4795 RepID=A0A225WJD7_9STRA|nr:hypothetical protein PHMEG_0009158 [Phytophthora megakarya]
MPVRVQEPMYTAQAQLQRRRRNIKRSRYSNSSSRRDPVLFERVDRNHPATPPRSVAAVPQALETTLTVLPPPLTSEAGQSTDSSIFHAHSLQPRYWGYASWN